MVNPPKYDDFQEQNRVTKQYHSANVEFVQYKCPLPGCDELVNVRADDIDIASMNGHLTAVEALLAAGAEVDAVSNDGTTALMEASHHGFLNVVRVLVFADADINARDRNGGTALIAASREGHIDTVQALLAAGAEVNAALNDGKTALWLATEEGHAHVVRVLLAVDGVEVRPEDHADVVQVLRKEDDALLRRAGVIE